MTPLYNTHWDGRSDSVQRAKGAKLLPSPFQLLAPFPVVGIHRNLCRDGAGFLVQPLNHLFHINGKGMFAVKQ
jgi:hypothetical protein